MGKYIMALDAGTAVTAVSCLMKGGSLSVAQNYPVFPETGLVNIC